MIDLEIAPGVTVVPHLHEYREPDIPPAERDSLDYCENHPEDDPIGVIVFDFEGLEP